MEDRDRTTLAVAAAGIAATALVGIAGVVGAWLSARDDRQAQHSLAREERTYERRVAVYLDAIDFVEGQQNSLHTYADKFRERQFRERHGAQLYPSRERTFPREWGIQFGDVPYQHLPPPRLTTRLRAFGSSEVLDAFENAQALTLKMDIFFVAVSPSEVSGVLIDNPLNLHPLPRGARGYIDRETKANEKYLDALGAFDAQISRFEDTVHLELGPG